MVVVKACKSYSIRGTSFSVDLVALCHRKKKNAPWGSRRES